MREKFKTAQLVKNYINKCSLTALETFWWHNLKIKISFQIIVIPFTNSIF